jgi:hypothetical protein
MSHYRVQKLFTFEHVQSILNLVRTFLRHSFDIKFDITFLPGLRLQNYTVLHISSTNIPGAKRVPSVTSFSIYSPQQY